MRIEKALTVIDRLSVSLVCFNGISTIVSYLMPNPFLFIKTVLFQTIKFSSTDLFTV